MFFLFVIAVMLVDINKRFRRVGFFFHQPLFELAVGSLSTVYNLKNLAHIMAVL